MAAFRISMRGLLVLLVVVGLTMTVMVSDAELYSAALFSLTLLMLCSALAMAVYVPRNRCAFWLGFAAIGWLYLLLVYGLASESFRQSMFEYHLACALSPRLQRPLAERPSQVTAADPMKARSDGTMLSSGRGQAGASVLPSGGVYARGGTLGPGGMPGGTSGGMRGGMMGGTSDGMMGGMPGGMPGGMRGVMPGGMRGVMPGRGNQFASTTGPSISALSRTFVSLATLMFAWVSGCIAQAAYVRTQLEAQQRAAA